MIEEQLQADQTQNNLRSSGPDHAFSKEVLTSSTFVLLWLFSLSSRVAQREFSYILLLYPYVLVSYTLLSWFRDSLY